MLKSVCLSTFFELTVPSPGRVEEEINKISPHITPKIPPLAITKIRDEKKEIGVIVKNCELARKPSGNLWCGGGREMNMR